MANPHWMIGITAEQLARLRANRAFTAALLLGRAANSVRFMIRAGGEVGVADGAVAGRQRVNSYLLLSGILEEILKRVVPDVRRDLSHTAAWETLERLVTGDAVPGLRKAALERIRNDVSFHLSREHIETGLSLVPDGDYSVAHGDSASILDVHVDLADRVAGAFATRGSVGEESALLDATMGLATDLMIACDTVVEEVLTKLGLEAVVVPPGA